MITVAVVGGGLGGAIVFAIFGRFGAVAAALYLLLVATAVVHQWQGTGELTGLLRKLRKACWAIVALWAVIAAVSWAGERPWVPPASYAAVFAGFGAAVEWLTRAGKWWR